MTKKREYSLDVLKIVTTLVVLLIHYQQVFQGIPGLHYPFYAGSRTFFLFAVELFFVLSGFLMYRYEKRIREGMSFPRFFLRRYLRFLPLMAMSVTVYAALSWGLFYDHFRTTGELRGLYLLEEPSVWGWLVTALGLQAGWGPADPHINAPLWYISALLGCCLVFYGIVRVSRRLKISPCYFYAGMILLGISLNGHPYDHLPFLTASMARGYYSFFAGLLLAKVLEKRPVSLRTAGVCAGIVLVFFTAFRFSWTRALMEPNYMMLAGIVVLPALVTLFLSAPIRRLFAHPWLGTLGAIAFDVYIWHDTGNVLAAILGEAFSWNAFFYSVPGMVIWIALTWAFGAFSYFCIEKPIDRRVQAWMEKQPWA